MVQFLSVSGLLLLATCCPSLWLTVTRRESGPQPFLPVPTADANPIPPALHYQNRFDVMSDCCTPLPPEASAYDDDSSGAATAHSAARGALRAIWDRFGNGQPPGAGTAGLSRAAMTFIHLSDVQVRDGDVTLADPALSHRLDWLIPSFEYDPDQMAYGRYVAEAVFATINQAVAVAPGREGAAAPGVADANRPAFVMHTGDLIDAGVTTEADIAHRLLDHLAIPFFDVIGNHDVLVFGNMLPPKVAASNDDAGCVRAGSVLAPYLAYFQRHRPFWLPTKMCTDSGNGVQLIAADTHEQSLRNFVSHLKDPQDAAAVPAAAVGAAAAGLLAGCPTETSAATPAPTHDHGFDLNDDRGYYAFSRPFELAGKPRKAIFVALNSMDLLDGEGGNTGRIRLPQLRWLSATLACVGGKDLVFVFAHHGLSDIAVGDGVPSEDRNAPSPLEELLLEHNQRQHNIVAFFYGHHHGHAICREGSGQPRPSVCKSFYEVETASIVDYPQEGRLVRIKDVGAGLAFLELTTFGPRLAGADEFARTVAIAQRGAEKDCCRTGACSRCSEDLRPYRSDGADTNARLFFQLPEETQNAP